MHIQWTTHCLTSHACPVAWLHACAGGAGGPLHPHRRLLQRRHGRPRPRRPPTHHRRRPRSTQVRPQVVNLPPQHMSQEKYFKCKAQIYCIFCVHLSLLTTLLYQLQKKTGMRRIIEDDVSPHGKLCVGHTASPQLTFGLPYHP